MKRLLATWFGCGLLPGSPGTFGSAGAVIAWMLALAAWIVTTTAGSEGKLAGVGFPTPAVQAIALVTGSLAAFAIGVLLGPWAIVHLPSPRAADRELAREVLHEPPKIKPDPSSFVLDEVAGQWLALAFVPAGNWSDLAINAALAFAAFRFFDILKPWPCRRLELLPQGWGICADDMQAGLYAGLLVLAIRMMA